MQALPILLLAAGLAGCQQRQETPGERAAAVPKATTATPPASAADPVVVPEQTPDKPTLALTSNALQVVSQPRGTTTEIALGMPLEQVVATVTKVLQLPVKSQGVNGECSVGPLQMTSWNNGLSLAFQQKKGRGAASAPDWRFVGWYLGPAAEPAPRLTTMAGIGIGTTRAELESAYTVKFSNSSLGTEFATSAGLYGLVDGPGPNAKITGLWSGTSCVFR